MKNKQREFEPKDVDSMPEAYRTKHGCLIVTLIIIGFAALQIWLFSD